MGRDKALIEIDGVPMARRVRDALSAAGATVVVAVGGSTEDLAAAGLETVADDAAGAGPLGGVITALRHVGGHPVVAVLSCDLLAPDPGLVRDLVEALHAGTADVVVPVVQGRAQWTHAVWRRHALRSLEDAFAAGERSLVGSVTGLRLDLIEVDDPDRTADADVPDDLPDSTAPD